MDGMTNEARPAATDEPTAIDGVSLKSRSHITRLTLTDFRNYRSARLETSDRPVVLVGHNGAGKTNILEAVSLLAPGQGLRRAAYPDMTRANAAAAGWSIAAEIDGPDGRVSIGTGLSPETASGRSGGRIVRIDGETQRATTALADFLEMVWLTPALDALFTGPAGDRRRFLDRLVICFDPEHGTRSNRYERAIRQRNRLLDIGATRASEYEGLEQVIAECAVAITAARADVVDAIAATMAARRMSAPQSPFPWAEIALEGHLEPRLAQEPAADVEEAFIAHLARMRDRDRAAGRTLDGPHRSDLVVGHGPKQMPARLCSTGEQKALLVGLVLAHAQMLSARARGAPPILLLDEIAAHLDMERRAALFAEILKLGAQAWMTGTDLSAFSAIREHADVFEVSHAAVRRVPD